MLKSLFNAMLFCQVLLVMLLAISIILFLIVCADFFLVLFNILGVCALIVSMYGAAKVFFILALFFGFLEFLLIDEDVKSPYTE